jgi:hypothetical protein
MQLISVLPSATDCLLSAMVGQLILARTQSLPESRRMDVENVDLVEQRLEGAEGAEKGALGAFW